ncbi:MAG: hypothetical protein ACOCM4_13060 [Acetivibrio ethanolgignens]
MLGISIGKNLEHGLWVDCNGSLAITVTGLTPASVIQLRWTHDVKRLPRKTLGALDLL